MVGLDVDDLADAVRQSIRAMTTFLENAPPDAHAPFPGCMLDRAAFDAALVERAIRAGAQCRFGVTVRGLTQCGEIELSTGETLSAKVIVGADGPRSAVGRAIGQVNRELVETRQITVPLSRAHDATDIFLSAEIPGGYGWLFPKRDVANLGAGVDPAYQGRLKSIVASLHATLIERGRVGREILGLTGGLIPVGGMNICAGMLGSTLVVLAGDAAGLTNPITGAGIASAVHSGRLAGQAAAGWTGGDQSAGGEYREELETVFKPALDRAVARRRELAAGLAAGALPRERLLRRGWIAYPEYWAA
jgi:digeranylgeranylglycerophospholipid reductase